MFVHIVFVGGGRPGICQRIWGCALAKQLSGSRPSLRSPWATQPLPNHFPSRFRWRHRGARRPKANLAHEHSPRHEDSACNCHRRTRDEFSLWLVLNRTGGQSIFVFPHDRSDLVMNRCLHSPNHSWQPPGLTPKDAASPAWHPTFAMQLPTSICVLIDIAKQLHLSTDGQHISLCISLGTRRTIHAHARWTGPDTCPLGRAKFSTCKLGQASMSLRWQRYYGSRQEPTSSAFPGPHKPQEVISIVTSSDKVHDFIAKHTELVEAFAEHTQLDDTSTKLMSAWISYSAKGWMSYRYDREEVKALITDKCMPRSGTSGGSSGEDSFTACRWGRNKNGTNSQGGSPEVGRWVVRRVLVEQCVWLVIAYRAPRRQLIAQACRALDGVQRRMLPLLSGTVPHRGEEISVFVRLRARSAAVDCRAAGLRSVRAARLVVQRSDYMARHRRHERYWPAILTAPHGAQWFARRRLAHVALECAPLRWHDTAAYVCRLILAQWGRFVGLRCAACNQHVRIGDCLAESAHMTTVALEGWMTIGDMAPFLGAREILPVDPVVVRIRAWCGQLQPHLSRPRVLTSAPLSWAPQCWPSIELAPRCTRCPGHCLAGCPRTCSRAPS